MAKVLLWGLAIAGALADTGEVLMFVGTGNCDGEDPNCVEGPYLPEQFIRPLLVQKNGSMSIPTLEHLSIRTLGAPVWLTTVGNGLKDGCLIATVANTSEIFTYSQRFDGLTRRWVPSGGVNPVYASVANEGHTLLVANYHGPDNSNSSEGASVASFTIGKECHMELVDVKKHSGNSVNPTRQGGAHVHSVVSVRGGLAYACDLGMDQIFTYRVASDGKLTLVGRTRVKAGSGPRHLVQHPSKDVVYVVSEMGQSVSSFKQIGDGEHLQELQSIPVGPNPGSKAAEIAISQDGSLVFVTNRGLDNTVSVFNTNAVSGELTLKTKVDAPVFPRGMALIADDTILLVAGQSKTEVWSYIVSKDGGLTLAKELHSTGDGLGLPPHPATFTSFSPYSPLNQDVIV